VDKLSPDELIRAILTAPVDLFWNGGIGTYVKAESETHDQVGDRGNNALRVNGKDLRCKVVGEGGNLGFTQRGRIEYANIGGRLNTDAIDNSAGVDCSDHEVNIKIALGAAMQKGKLTLEKRDAFLAGMTDEVARLVLRDNTLQTHAITIAQLQGFDSLESQVRLMRHLERDGQLDRAGGSGDRGFQGRRGAEGRGRGVADRRQQADLLFARRWEVRTDRQTSPPMTGFCSTAAPRRRR